MIPFYTQTLASQSGVGTLFNTYTTAKSILNVIDTVSLPPQYLSIGSKFRIRASGGLSNIVTTPGTFVAQVMMGAIAVFSTGNIQLNATAHTLLPFSLEIILRVDSTGASTSAKFLGDGTLIGIQPTLTLAQVDAVNVPGAFKVPATAPAVGTGFDSTVTNILDFWWGFSSSNAGNGVQLYDYTVEQLRG